MDTRQDYVVIWGGVAEIVGNKLVGYLRACIVLVFGENFNDIGKVT